VQLLCTWIDAGDSDVLEEARLPHLLGALSAGLLNRNIVTDDLRSRVGASILGLKVNRCSLY
jgi:hypothetical protein